MTGRMMGRMRWSDIETGLRARLLPPVIPPGAMPFFSLSYLLMLLFPAFMPRFPSVNWTVTAASMLVFLPMYFGFYWLRGWRRVATLIGMIALALAILPANFFANTYVIYACILAAHLSMVEMLCVFVVANAALTGTVFALGGPATTIGLINVLSGGMAMFGCRAWYQNARKNQALKLSQLEVQRIAALAERERIGRDLHDLLGHTLSVIALKSELAAKLIDRDIDAARVEIKEVERVTRQALFEVRRAVTGMRAHGLLAELASGRAALASAQVHFDYQVQPQDLPTQTENVLAMCLREAVTNIIRHAHARRCHARLDCAEARVVLEISDDGVGGVRAEGNGLSGMRERIEAAGGRLLVESPKEGGTQLRIELPMTLPEPEHALNAARHLKLVASR
ncbi:MAG: sensor histidine kinase [Rhodanobacteraceae bacterium]|nr:sensor histidine kinase [Rhodanobacteraceae bacterium]MBL0041142.1 sensor histidine kinase [Xanthomonadales bacterium]